MTITSKNTVSSSSLFEISRQAKSDSAKAEQALLDFVRKIFPKLKVEKIRIRKSKVSLNSVNGFMETPAREYFFKFHTEENETESLSGNEYYQGKELQKAGLPMITPLYESTTPGSQFLIYEKIDASTAFDLFETEDIRFLETGKYDTKQKDALLAAEKELLKQQCEVYLSFLQKVPSAEVSSAALNQLFFNRLVSVHETTPRLDLFYTNAHVHLSEQSIPFSEFAKLQWTINGIEYQENLAEMIAAAKDLLNPLKEEDVAVVLGHGDDHNGNKFFLDGKFYFFDPAFAGMQPALLSFVKATVHNTFAHPFWLYDPERIQRELEIEYTVSNGNITVRHNWNFPDRSPLRQEILELQAKFVWKPLLREMKRRNILPKYWREYLRKAFFCCPFLVYNLLDTKKYSPEACLLALGKCVELGSKSISENCVDKFFARIAP